MIANGKRRVCLRSQAMFLDIFPPPILNICLSRWAPTIEYTTRFFNRPSPEIKSRKEKEEKEVDEAGGGGGEGSCEAEGEEEGEVENPEYIIIDYRTTYIKDGWFMSETKLMGPQKSKEKAKKKIIQKLNLFLRYSDCSHRDLLIKDRKAGKYSIKTPDIAIISLIKKYIMKKYDQDMIFFYALNIY